MELTLERDQLLTAVTKAKGATLGTTTIPMLQNLLLTADAEGLVVRGSEPELQIAARSTATVTTGGAATVPAGRLHDALRTLPPGGQVQLVLLEKESRVTLKCGRSRFQLPTLPVQDFPASRPEEGGTRAQIAAKDLARLIDRASFMISTEQTRYYMGGLYLHVIADAGRSLLRAVATDGARLARVETTCPEGWSGAKAVTVPRKALNEIRRLLEGVSGDVDIWTNGSSFSVGVGDDRLITSVVDGSFPDYTRVTGGETPRVLTFDVEDLIAALKRCVVMTGDKIRAVKMSIAAGEVLMRSRSLEAGGEAEAVIEVGYKGEPCELSFNAGYLLEIAGQAKGEKLVMSFGGSADPVKLTDPLDTDCLYICMPLRV